MNHSETSKKPTVRKLPIPIPLLIIYGTTAVATVLYFLFRSIPAFADAWNTSVGAVLRRVLAYGTTLFPFSLAETLLIGSPLILGFLIFIGIRYFVKSLRGTLVYCGSILAAVCIIWQLFALAFAPGYFVPTLDKKLGIERKNVSAQQLYDTARILIDAINETNDEVLYRGNGFSMMPYTYSDMNGKLLDAYEVAGESFDAIRSFQSTVKPVALSEPMSYTHITGVYTFFTGEANINVNFPDYSIPYTAAHELAHQRGFAREDEANFIAFLVCSASDDPYIRYSGYVRMYEYVMSALYRADKDLYFEARGTVEPIVITEQRAYAEFFKKYEHSTVGEVSGAINNSYLQSQGTVGTRSYGMVVDLTVAYFEART